MRIRTVLSGHRSDYVAEMECEHCNHIQRDIHGYNDWNYHNHVIPIMRCAACGKSRNDLTSPEAKTVAPVVKSPSHPEIRAAMNAIFNGPGDNTLDQIRAQFNAACTAINVYDLLRDRDELAAQAKEVND